MKLTRARIGGRLRRTSPGPAAAPTSIRGFTATPDQRAALAASAGTELERLFYAADGRPVLKWSHYLPLYDQYFTPYRGTHVGLLEIGVFHGGSLDLWREFLGPDARILGVDIDPACADRVTPPNQVEIGSQDDPDLLRAAAARLGRLDAVIDDGSHFGHHQWVSFETLFPLLEPGGIYVIEDLHTSYWPDYHGGPDVRTTGICLVREVIDRMHRWYYVAEDDALDLRAWVPEVHVHDSIVFIRKARRERPVNVVSGGPAPDGVDLV